VYAYAFQLFAIGVSLGPFLVSTDSLSSSESWVGFVHGCLRAEEGYAGELTRCATGSSDGQWLVHFGSRPLDIEANPGGEARSRTEYSRGLVEPLYVVVLAIIGGAVGMSRRLPELQRRAAYSFHKDRKEEDPDPISSIEAREKIVFQIMQVLAAPLIAIVAFAAFEPDTVTAAVLIGFASGFPSEAILMKLRQASVAVVVNVK